MSPSAFKSARRTLNLSVEGCADLLRLGAHGGDTVRRWERGARDIPGPVVVLMELLLRYNEVQEMLLGPDRGFLGADDD